MKNLFFTLMITAVILPLTALRVNAQVLIKTVVANGSICEDHYTTLTDLVISEIKKDDIDIGDLQTVIMTLPSGYEFKVGAAIVTYAAGADITGASVSIGLNTITLTYTAATKTNFDAINISGMWIKRQAGAATSDYLTRTGGTATINGCPDGTILGTFAQGTLCTYASAAALAQDNGIRVDFGSTDNLMMRCLINLTPPVNGCNTSLTLENIVFDANGSTDPENDLVAAHIYYTGNSGTFGMDKEFGSYVGPLTSTPIQVDGSQLLLAGNNFFWITFDVSPTAAYNNTIDCSFISADVSGLTKYTSTPNPVNTYRLTGIPVYISKKTGNWNDSATWLQPTPLLAPYYPNGTTHAQILNGHTVTLTAGASIIDLTVDAGGTLNLSTKQLVQFGEIFCYGAVNSTPKSRLYIGDFDRVRPTYPIPAGITTLQKLVIARAFGATCDHDLRIGDVCPTVLNMGTGLLVMDTGSINGANNPYPPLWLSSGVLTMTNGAVLRMENTDSLPYKIACSDLTYVDGKISRWVRNDDRWHEYPVGDGGICRKAGISKKPGAAGITEIQFFKAVPPNIGYVKKTDFPGGISSNYYWKVKDISGNQPKRMFYYKDADFSGFTEVLRIMCLGIAMNEVTTPTDEWHQPTSPTVSVDDMEKWVQQVNNNNSTHEYWTLASTCLNMPLPVEMLYLKARENAGDVNIKWATASETGNDFFSVEKSTDNENFTETDIVRGAGTCNRINYYESTDKNAFSAENQINYYRIRQTDYNGQSSVSQTVAVMKPGARPVITAYKSNGSITVNVMSGENCAAGINVYDMVGKLISRKDIIIAKGTSAIVIDADIKENSLYLVSFHNKDTGMVTSFKVF